MIRIKEVYGREVLDSRGWPTVETVAVVVDHLNREYRASAKVPAGASKGTFEAKELRDKDEKRYGGKGVLKAVYNINNIIASKLKNVRITHQSIIDDILLELDDTKDKSNLGANAILGVSLAVSKATAKALNIPLYSYIGGCLATTLPVPLLNVINGGLHADNNLDIQEFMIIPQGANCFSEAIRMGVEVYHTLKKIIKKNNFSTNVGDEGGFAPDLSSTEEALKLLTESIEEAGYKIGKDIFLGLDVAASTLYDKNHSKYKFIGENKTLFSEELIDYYIELIKNYFIILIEDGFAEEDITGWRKFTEKIKNIEKEIILVGDDIFVTNPEKLKEGIDCGIANAILIKPNQIGTLSEMLDTIHIAQKAGYKYIISHRSGETEDTTIADIAVGTNAWYIKAGAPCRSERLAKYNRLLEIEEELGSSAKFASSIIL